ncbi:hypothetical protein IFM89_011253 [Coptis chinensis]|uniref:tyrosine--tRNA ligase n=1 Tax=Coptis chinensis TaxID=261450 RepID=A0A835LMQ4_9MAGN|nr:hypothetical protein IFM89_011253 [Coptis chinensis]
MQCDDSLCAFHPGFRDGNPYSIGDTSGLNCRNKDMDYVHKHVLPPGLLDPIIVSLTRPVVSRVILRLCDSSGNKDFQQLCLGAREGLKKPIASGHQNATVDNIWDGNTGERRVLTLEERFKIVRSIGEECIQEDELMNLLEKKPQPIAYDGFEPSGRMHIAQVYMYQLIYSSHKNIMLNLETAGVIYVLLSLDV